MNENLLTTSWAVFFGTSAAIWALTTALAAHMTDMQRAIRDNRLRLLLEGLSDKMGLTPETLVETARTSGLDIVTTPDLTTEIRLLRYQAAAFLMTAFLLNIAGVAVYHMQPSVTPFERYFLPACAIVVCSFCLLFCLARPLNAGGLLLLSELAQWRRLKRKFRKAW